MIFLETERLLFRTHQLEDEADFVQMQTDPEVRRYVGGQGRGWPMEKALYRFRNNYLGKPTKIYGLWATILKSEQKYLGSCGLRSGQNKTAHLGYYLAQPYWRRGFATEASRAFIEVAFGRLRLTRLLADFDMENAVSEHLLRKFGFQYKSKERIEATGRTIVSYELRQANWKRETP
jgi:RimJ/RimL family protein N-acetyltransferase